MAKRTPKYPTGQRLNVVKALGAALRKLEVVEDRLVSYVRDLPSHFVPNQYDYPNVLPIDNVRSVQDIVYGGLDTEEDNEPPLWWLFPYVELSYRQGALEQMMELQRQAGRLTPVQTGEGYLSTRHYRRGLHFVQSDAYLSIKTLGEKTAAQVIREINSGIGSGLSNEQITSNVVDRLDVSRSNAARIVDTEINKTYNRARLRAVQAVRDETGLDLQVQHISALTATTRKHHADRHMQTYTPQAQLEWWSRGANAINCKCSVRSVLNED